MRPVDCAGTGACDPTGRYQLAADGSYAKGLLLNTYVTEAWQRPKGCVARGVDGAPLVHGTDEQVLPLDPDADCLEGPLMGVQFGTYATDQGTPDANFGANVDGNFGFGDACLNGTLDASDPANPVCLAPDGTDGSSRFPAADYLVEVDIPNDATGKPLYKVTREEDVNIGNGDEFVPAVPPPACAGAAPHGRFVREPDLPEAPGLHSRAAKPLCNVKLVQLTNGKSVVPVFHLFTDVPMPTRFWGLIVDDLTFSADPRSLLYGEKAGVPFAPVGIYDYTNRLITTVESDFNGLFDVLLPSTNRINCPTPSGVCANLYRFVGNDPGRAGPAQPELQATVPDHRGRVRGPSRPARPGRPGADPGGRHRAASWWADQLGELRARRGRRRNSTRCPSPTPRQQQHGTLLHHHREGLWRDQWSGQVTLGDTALPTTLVERHPDRGERPGKHGRPGPKQLKITAANGQSTVNGLTFHVISDTGEPGAAVQPAPVFEVGPGRTYAPDGIAPGRWPTMPSSGRSTRRPLGRWSSSTRMIPAGTLARTRAAPTTRT